MAAETVGNEKHLERTFSRVILTLDNIRIPDAATKETPSEQDGLNRDVERQLRHLGCTLIQSAGILLKLPQVAVATGQILFQRFYFCKSFIKHNMEHVAMACVHLASKIEEHPRRIRDVLNVFYHLNQARLKKPFTPMVLDQSYINQKNHVIKAERRVLKELGFCVHVKHPHKIIVMYLQILEYEKNRHLVQKAWNYMNDSMKTHVFVAHTPEAIACACIHIAARDLRIPMPTSPRPWYVLFDTTEEEVDEIGGYILDHYRLPRGDPDVLEAAVEECRKKLAEGKVKNKTVPSAAASDGGDHTPKLSYLHSTDSKPSSVQGSPGKRQTKSPSKVENGTDESKGNGQEHSPSTSGSSRSGSHSDHRHHRRHHRTSSRTNHRKTSPKSGSRESRDASSAAAATMNNNKYADDRPSKRSRHRRGGSRSPSPPDGALSRKRARKQRRQKRSRSSSRGGVSLSPTPPPVASKKHHKKRRGKTRRSRSRSRSVVSVSPGYRPGGGARSRSHSRERNRKRRKDRHYYRERDRR